MRQTGTYKWEIVSEKDVILQPDISLGSLYQAHDYISRWITSYTGWMYEVIPLLGNPVEVKYESGYPKPNK